MTTDETSGAREAVSTAKDEAAGLAQAGAQGGQDLLQEIKDEGLGVAAEATGQARHLLGEARTGLVGQVSEQQVRAAASLRSLGDELGRMADGSEQGGLATDLVRQAAGHTGTVAGWLEDREPGDVLHEVSEFARRRPGVFLALAAGAGVLAGRLTRGLKDAPSGGLADAGSRKAVGPASVANTQDLSGALDVTAASGAVAQSSGSGVPAPGEAGGQHRGPEPAQDDDLPVWPPLQSEEDAWAASGEAPAERTPGHLPGSDEPGTAGGDPLAGVLREDRP